MNGLNFKRIVFLGTSVVSLGVLSLAMGTASGQTSNLDGEQLAMSLGELEEEISRRETDLRRYAEQLEELDRQNNEISRRLDQRARVLGEREGEVRGRIITLCRLSRGGVLQMLRGSRTLTDLIQRTRHARAVMDQDFGVLLRHQREVGQLEAERRELTVRIERQQELRRRIVEYQQELEGERQRRLSNPPRGNRSKLPAPFEL